MTADTPAEPSRLRRLRAGVRAHPWAAAAAVAGALLLLLLLLAAIRPNAAPAWTGFGRQPHPNGWVMIPYKTLWDWMELLLVPLFIAGAAGLVGLRQQQQQYAQDRRDRELAAQQRENETQIAREQAQQRELEQYYKDMGALLLQHGLAGADAGAVRSLARARTLSTLDAIDGRRKGLLLRFLYEARLIMAPAPVIDLYGADLDDVQLRFSDLGGACLAGANLRDATLSGVDLRGADLSRASLNRATLRCAVLAEVTAVQARFSGASLRDATLSGDFSGATFALADAQDADWRGARLAQAVLEGMDGRGGLLHGLDLSQALLGEAGGSRADFSGAFADAATIWPAGFDAAAAGVRAAPPPPDHRARCEQIAAQYRRE